LKLNPNLNRVDQCRDLLGLQRLALRTEQPDCDLQTRPASGVAARCKPGKLADRRGCVDAPTARLPSVSRLN
jgi:hypothetical protein